MALGRDGRRMSACYRSFRRAQPFSLVAIGTEGANDGQVLVRANERNHFLYCDWVLAFGPTAETRRGLGAQLGSAGDELGELL